MPKVTLNAHEQTTNSPIDQAVSSLTGEISLSSNPIFICGVNRKINIGNFENVDVYAGITIPLENIDFSDKEAFSEAVKNAAAYGFSLVSKETGERYTLIKESQQNGR
jgi:hypothetical protein